MQLPARRQKTTKQIKRNTVQNKCHRDRTRDEASYLLSLHTSTVRLPNIRQSQILHAKHDNIREVQCRMTHWSIVYFDNCLAFSNLATWDLWNCNICYKYLLKNSCENFKPICHPDSRLDVSCSHGSIFSFSKCFSPISGVIQCWACIIVLWLCRHSGPWSYS